MTHVGFTDFRQKLASHLDAVVENHVPLVVTRSKGKAVVVLSEEDYESMQETLYLLGNPANAKWLRESIAEFEHHGGTEHALDLDP